MPMVSYGPRQIHIRVRRVIRSGPTGSLNRLQILKQVGSVSDIVVYCVVGMDIVW